MFLSFVYKNVSFPFLHKHNFFFFQSVLATGSFLTTYLGHYEKYIYSDNNNNNNNGALILY